MKWLKRLFAFVALLLVVAILVSAVSYHLATSAPDFYPTQTVTTQQAETSARAAEDKLINLRNWVQTPSTNQGEVFTLQFTSEELDAFFQKWLNQFQSKYEGLFENPHLLLHQSNIVVMGKLKERNVIASLHFDPQIDKDGQLDMNLARIMGGKLPLPEMALDRPKAKAIKQLKDQLPYWRRDANLNPDGSCNSQMARVGFSELVISVLTHQPVDSQLMVPIDGNSAMPVQVKGIKVGEKTLSMDLTILSPEERQKLLKRIQGTKD